MKACTFFTVLLGLTLAVSLNGYSLYERNGLGNLVPSFDARTSAMGGTSAADGFSLLQNSANPAGLGFMQDHFTFQASAGFMRDNDRRELAMYDSFDEIVDEATYAENTNLYANYAVAAAYRTQLGHVGLGFGFSFRPLLNFDCHYTEEVRTDDTQDNNTYPPIIANNLIKGSGAVDAFGLTFACDTDALPYVQKAAFGVEIAPLSGSQNLKTQIQWTQAAQDSVATFELPDYYNKIHRDYDGTRVVLGTRFQVNPRLGLGFSYALKTTLNTDSKLTVLNNNTDAYNTSTLDEDDAVLPTTIHWGLSFQPRNVARTVFNVDMEWVKWDDVNDAYDNTMRYSLGVEHNITNALPFRMGFAYECSPLDKEISLPTFTIGTGYNFLDHWTLDFAAAFSNRSYDTLDLFPDSYYDDTQYTDAPNYTSRLWNYVVPTDRDWSHPDKVEELFINLMTTITFRW